VIRGALFYGSAAFLGATWLGYPAALMLRARRPITRGPFHGTVSVICVARDEPRIGERVVALRAQSQTIDQIIVVDDGSGNPIALDATVIRQESLGKSAGIRAALAHATGDVVVFCDVRQRLAPDAIEQLLRPLADPEVGCVSALLSTPVTRGPGLYWRYETMVRLFETRSGSVVGATGALYVTRRSLIVAPPDGLVLDDVWIPMHAAKAGYRVVLEQDAHVTDVEADVAHEAHRKQRTLAGNHQLFAAAPWLRSPRHNPLYMRTLIHKRARLYTPLALATMVVTAPPRIRLLSLGVLATWLVRRRYPSFGGRLGAALDTLVALNVAAARAWLTRGPIRWRTDANR